MTIPKTPLQIKVISYQDHAYALSGGCGQGGGNGGNGGSCSGGGSGQPGSNCKN